MARALTRHVNTMVSGVTADATSYDACLHRPPGLVPSGPAEAAGTWDEILQSQGGFRAAASQCRTAGSEAHTLLPARLPFPNKSRLAEGDCRHPPVGWS